ncbi:low-complexity tail membrane protein [Cyanobacterium sp. uoEpiScrs1]|uniref:low-complexity tail membrane protein n=1 Tax=Cyanobacterium sp. uoEpiScrs1 TaxID=2976343 RepID=UPI002269BD88|nr:low-complexity tail membrane protein [Cyanobacterium sp. uoEpiScrs1]
MNNFRSEPFLWIHLAGIAVVPLSLQLVWLGLAIGEPLPIFWLELFIVGLFGIAPIFLMQWTKPFNIFSILLIFLSSDSLTVEQRKILKLLKTRNVRILTVIVAFAMLGILWELYLLAPLGVITVATLPQWRILGLFISAIGFLLSNLFVQIPIAVIDILLTPQQQWLIIEPYTTEKIIQDFTVFGFCVQKILPIKVECSSSSK